ncbi:Alpha/Beta hydrolase protein [Mycena olivaceomarginata]|nr:Alpha/Beta hydrolase protein [Mycena olivaceomarginata]
MSPFPSLRGTLSYILFFIASVVAGPPTISLSYGTFQGLSDGNLTKFLGVPFAQSGRFEVPKAPGLLRGLQNATAFRPACPQQALTPLPIPFASAPYPFISENCHALDIFKPSSPGSGYRLPVFIWLYGGAFEVGNSRDTNVSPVVERSVQTGEPIITVVPNYRLSAFGFLARKEVRAAGVTNLGLRDPVAKAPAQYRLPCSCSPTTGIPTHCFVGRSWSPVPQSAPSPTVLQSHYDTLVAANNCRADTETLSCLRRVPLDSFMATVNRTADIFSYQSLALVWQPYVDGDVVAHDLSGCTPRQLRRRGNMHNQGNAFIEDTQLCTITLRYEWRTRECNIGSTMQSSRSSCSCKIDATKHLQSRMDDRGEAVALRPVPASTPPRRRGSSSPLRAPQWGGHTLLLLLLIGHRDGSVHGHQVEAHERPRWEGYSTGEGRLIDHNEGPMPEGRKAEPAAPAPHPHHPGPIALAAALDCGRRLLFGIWTEVNANANSSMAVPAQQQQQHPAANSNPVYASHPHMHNGNGNMNRVVNGNGHGNVHLSRNSGSMNLPRQVC